MDTKLGLVWDTRGFVFGSEQNSKSYLHCVTNAPGITCPDSYSEDKLERYYTVSSYFAARDRKFSLLEVLLFGLKYCRF